MNRIKEITGTEQSPEVDLYLHRGLVQKISDVIGQWGRDVWFNGWSGIRFFTWAVGGV